ncbi:unnamed protein product [Parnassius mnemosyne]|uniref:Maturase K n=1 Tax=Parnassius mnemosyne TaxID=213953 RepID=A0AAV1LKG1_9NEOP
MKRRTMISCYYSQIIARRKLWSFFIIFRGIRQSYFILYPIFFSLAMAVRLHKLFQYIDGFKSEHNLKGFLHVGNDYAVFLRVPKSHDQYLIYELYETRQARDINTDKPNLLAISKVPVNYIREQLNTFHIELYKSKYEDSNIIPGTNVKTLREWQIDQSLSYNNTNGLILADQPNILRTVL